MGSRDFSHFELYETMFTISSARHHGAFVYATDMTTLIKQKWEEKKKKSISINKNMLGDKKKKKIPTLNASHVKPKPPDLEQHAGRQNSSQKIKQRNEKSLNIDM